MLPTWTFDRQGEQLIVQRDTRDGTSCALIVTLDGLSRTIEFPELPALVRFQTDMDTFLLRTGWLLLTYAPDRRRRDRRHFPRVSNDRRRWWTDGVEPETGPTGKERRRRAQSKAGYPTKSRAHKGLGSRASPPIRLKATWAWPRVHRNHPALLPK